LQMRHVTQAHMELVGEAFWLKERNQLGVPIAVWPIPPSWVVNTPTPASPVYRVQFRGWRAEIPEREMLWFMDPDPANPYGRGSGVAQSLGDELESDEYAARTSKAWYFNSARPDLIISAAGLSETQTRKLEQDWNSKHQGFFNKFRTHFLNADVSIQQMGGDFRSGQFVQIRNFARDVCVHSFGVPPEVLGIIENSNRSTIDAASYLFNSMVVVPRLEFVRAILQERLIPEWDDRLILDYVDPVEEDRERNLAAAKVAPYALSIDEWRELQGKAPLPGGQGKVYMIPWDVAAYRGFVNDGQGRQRGVKSTGQHRHRCTRCGKSTPCPSGYLCSAYSALDQDLNAEVPDVTETCSTCAGALAHPRP
jgi:phage portal protein BeeE